MEHLCGYALSVGMSVIVAPTPATCHTCSIYLNEHQGKALIMGGGGVLMPAMFPMDLPIMPTKVPKLN